MKNQVTPWHLPLMLLAVVSVVLGTWVALVRVGWVLPTPFALTSHGPLMIGGFFGALIGVERAVALGRRWVLIGPLCAATGAATLLIGQDAAAGGLMLTAALVMGATYLSVGVQHLRLHTLTMLIGALAWAAGAGLWLAGWPFPLTAHLWVAFLVLTIAGERLELARVTRPTPQVKRLFAVILALLICSAILALWQVEVGLRGVGAGYLLLGLWLLRFDVARRVMRLEGLTRFISVCLLAGYFWLVTGGLLLLAGGGQTAGFIYDAQLHSILVGFVFSMVVGHIPMIFPALSGIQLRFHPVLYGPLILLHASVLLRVSGDLAFWPPGRKWGGLLSLVAVLLHGLLLAILRRLLDLTGDGAH